MDALNKRFQETRHRTNSDLLTIAHSKLLQSLNPIDAPEVDAIVERVSQAVPAGNVPGMILNGLARLPGRKLPGKVVKRDVNMLFKGVEMALDRAVYGTFFAGPAAIIWGYQNLLKLAGKDTDQAFPEGIWQFYVDYALREDTARHTNETHGFDTILTEHNIQLSQIDRMTAWTMAAIRSLHQYHALLENEWRERVYIYHLREVTRLLPDAYRYADLFRRWEVQRPYKISTDAPNTNFPEYRKQVFNQFIKDATQHLSTNLRLEWLRRVEIATQHELPAYQQQMSILAYLEPGKYGETRQPLPRNLLHVGIIYDQRYYLIAACQPGTELPAEVATVRAQLATIVNTPPVTPPVQLVTLACSRRSALYNVRNNINEELREGLDALRLAPIMINFDKRSHKLPLAEIRQGERGVGDHALTIFDTERSFVFDQSHIFFDGAWGAAFAEMLTNKALSWARYLATLPPAHPAGNRPYTPLLPIAPEELKFIQKAPRVVMEASAETSAVNLKSILAVRRLFKERSDLLGLTVNDVLILYRAIHAVTYTPTPSLVKKLRQLAQNDTRTQSAVASALTAIEKTSLINPAILIPVDASLQTPRDRVHPLSFEVPLHELDLVDLYQQIQAALASFDNEAVFARFQNLQREFLANLAAFGKLLSQSKQIAVTGKSASAEAIRLLAHLPTSLQRLMDKVPGQFDVLNDLIKGREVFSNVGVVATSSSLARFITAKDDNEQKTLAWGVLTDSDGKMHLSLRDFRPHVALLTELEHKEVAHQIAQDYLDSYAWGLNNFILDLRSIILGRPLHLVSHTKPTVIQENDPLLGWKVGDYRIETALHYGHNAYTYQGKRLSDRSPVAIKIIDARTPMLARGLIKSQERIMQWQHEHISRIYHADALDELFYVVLEYTEGKTLAQVLADYTRRSEFMPYEEILRIGRSVAGALDYAHAREVIHCNLKPSNIILGTRVQVADFGLAIGNRRQPIGKDFSKPYYVAPEQAEGAEYVVPQTDIYALGVILYQMLTGMVPFDHYAVEGLIHQHKSYAPPNPLDMNPNLNSEIGVVLFSALKKAPQKRYTSAGALMDDLQKAIDNLRLAERRVSELPPFPAGLHPTASIERPAEKSLMRRWLRRV